MKSIYFIGVDVSKKTLDINVIKDGEVSKKAQVNNNVSALKQFFKQLINEHSDFAYHTAVVCLEHTGIYSSHLLNFMINARVNICMEPAIQIIRSQGLQRGKNDQIDAFRIAMYAYKNRDNLRFWKPMRPTIQKLKILLNLRERFIKIQNQLQVPLKESADFIDTSLQEAMNISSLPAIKAIGKSMEKVEQQIKALIASDHPLQTQFQRITSVQGIGPVTAAHIIVATNEFNRISDPKKFACFSGVAPFQYSSGTSIHGRSKVSNLANMQIKKLLFMAAMSAIQHCEELKTYYQRKTSEGKKHMSVINAVRNKLITRVFACIRDERNYEKVYKHELA